MDKYYGNVCELDIIFNFQKAYFILDELLLAGEMQESSKKNVLRVISAQDSIEDTEVSEQVGVLCAIVTLVSAPITAWRMINVLGNTHNLSYTDTSEPSTRSMKKSRRLCEPRPPYTCIQKIWAAGVEVYRKNSSQIFPVSSANLVTLSNSRQMKDL